MRQDDFAAGRSVRRVAVRVDPREMQQVRALPQAPVAPPARVIVTRPVAHPVPVSVQRPVLINQQGKQIAARPGATPIAPPVRPMPQPSSRFQGARLSRRQRVRFRTGREAISFRPHRATRSKGPTAYTPNPGSVPRANPVGPVQGIQRPNNQQPPTYQENRPNQPQNQPPSTENRQNPGPVQPTRRPDEMPPAPQDNGSQAEANASTPTTGAAGICASAEPSCLPAGRPAKQAAPPPQNKPEDKAQKPNNNNKDQKKNDKKNDQKDDKKHD